MSSKLAGTRQVRKMIGHVITGARVVYGCPVFMTVTPSERHSGLAIRLSRYRLKDPGVSIGTPEFQPYAGYDAPSLYGPEDMEKACVDLPEYDLRRLMTNRDPLCCLYAFLVNMKVILPNLYGLRMCPHCPHCVTTQDPCMDMFGSNATPMGGSAGRADAMVGAVEAQKAEGVLHLHLFLFLQMAFQYKTLAEIADMFRRELLSPEAWKRYIENVRRATYPDVEEFEKKKPEIEASWPAYADDFSLSRPPASLFQQHQKRNADDVESLLATTWRTEGAMWAEHYNKRLQHVLGHMNHHIHPMNRLTGERKPLRSCCRKDRPHECKAGFPLAVSYTHLTLPTKRIV